MNAPTLTERVNALLAVVETMTAGPWHANEALGSVYANGTNVDGSLVADMALRSEKRDALPPSHVIPNATGIAALRNDAPALIRELLVELERWRRILDEVANLNAQQGDTDEEQFYAFAAKQQEEGGDWELWSDAEVQHAICGWMAGLTYERARVALSAGVQMVASTVVPANTLKVGDAVSLMGMLNDAMRAKAGPCGACGGSWDDHLAPDGGGCAGWRPRDSAEAGR